MLYIWMISLIFYRYTFLPFSPADHMPPYEPLYWGAVFPLGMYTVATHRLATVLQLAFLAPVARVLLVVALVAWGAAFVGLLRALARLVTSRRHPTGH
jgi:tellurite resistance protein TehA-like permease